MTLPYPNPAPIGAEFTVAGRRFETDTPRSVVADALQRAGRRDEAALLRGPEPVVLDHRVCRPDVGHVVRALRRAAGDACDRVFLASSSPGGYHQVHAYDVLAEPDGRTAGFGCRYVVRWPSGDTARVLDAVRGQEGNCIGTAWQAVRALAAAGVPMELCRLEAGRGAPVEEAWERMPVAGAMAVLDPHAPA